MLAYLLPFIFYVIVPSGLVALWNDAIFAYAAKVLIVLPMLVFFLKDYKEIKPEKDWIGIALGLFVFVSWVGLEPYYPKFFGEPPAFDPSSLFYTTLILKLVGMVVLAPWVEELFFRSFLPRYLQAGRKWQEVPIGTFTPFTFITTALIFGLAHHQWLPAIMMGFLMNWLYSRTKNLFPCIIAHSIANFLLWVTAVSTGNWAIW